MVIISLKIFLFIVIVILIPPVGFVGFSSMYFVMRKSRKEGISATLFWSLLKMLISMEHSLKDRRITFILVPVCQKNIFPIRLIDTPELVGVALGQDQSILFSSEDFVHSTISYPILVKLPSLLTET